MRRLTFKPVALWRLSARLHRSGNRRLARLVQSVNHLVFHCVLPPEFEAGTEFDLGHRGLGVVIHPNVTIGDQVYLHHGVTLATDVDPPEPVRMVIGSRVSIGANAVLLGAITVGDDVSIGAGAVVTGDLPDGAVAVGVPARVVSLDGAQKHHWLPKA